jgi:hypothetical protein
VLSTSPSSRSHIEYSPEKSERRRLQTHIYEIQKENRDKQSKHIMPLVLQSKQDTVTSMVRDVIDDLEVVATGCPAQDLDVEIAEQLLDASLSSEDDVAECLAGVFAVALGGLEQCHPSDYQRRGKELFERMRRANLVRTPS